MTKQIILAALTALTVSPAFAEAGPALMPPAATTPKEDLVRVELETEKVRIVIALDRGRAPLTTANFLSWTDPVGLA